MKTFTFRLQTVLNLRAREEEQARDAYAQALHARARLESEIRDAATTLDSYYGALRSAREGVSNRQHQLLFLAALQRQHTCCDGLAAKLVPLEREVALRREEMLDARRRREALTRLEEKQQCAHKAESVRAEESMIGDMITARHALGLMEAVA